MTVTLEILLHDNRQWFKFIAKYLFFSMEVFQYLNLLDNYVSILFNVQIKYL